MKKATLSILCLSFSLILWYEVVFWFETEEQTERKETVKEIQANIESLKKEKSHLDFKWDTYRIGNENLWNLLKSDLSDEQKLEIEEIIIEYKDSLDKYEGKISITLDARRDEVDAITNEFLIEKREFYMSLIKYVEVDKLEDYMTYINSDLNFNEKSNEVAVKIEQKNIQKEERIEEIQKQIHSNTNILRDRIREKVTTRVTEKLDSFVTEEKFSQLSNGGKIIVFQKLQSKVQNKIEELKSHPDPTSIEENLFLHEIINEIIQWYIDNWSEEVDKESESLEEETFLNE